MATFMDFSLLTGAKGIFAFLLVFCIVYGIIKFTNVLDLNDGLTSIISLAMAFFFVLNPATVTLVEVLAPWYTVMMFMIVIILMMVMMFGNFSGDFQTVTANLGSRYKVIVIWIIVISLLILAGGVGTVFLSGESSPFSVNKFENSNESEISDQEHKRADVGGTGPEAFMATLFHPKVITSIMVLLIAALAVFFLSSNTG
ncbi:MAG: hypothetical protein ACQER9_01895 [Nanobdellota archaeon]